MRFLHGDMREKIGELADGSIDSIVTDPPYHLTTGKKGGSGPASLNEDSPAGRARIGTGFMGMRWDGGDIAMRPETWALLLRVAKPGAHLLAFGGSRTFHRVWTAVEDAGWEIRDTLLWLHGEGFPKSSNQKGDWLGWGTALKPAFEPIVMARKPLIGTVAQNLEAHRVGALNIDACRVAATGEKLHGGIVSSRQDGWDRPWKEDETSVKEAKERGQAQIEKSERLGRWPANVLHDGSDAAVGVFPGKAGAFAPVRGTEPSEVTANVFGDRERVPGAFHADRGSAARFFWSPKASKRDRNDGLHGMPREAVNWSSGDQAPGTFKSPNTDRLNENHHPTVKPTELMQYLCRLVTPRGGVVLDPFMGSGSTGKAAMREGMSFVGIELDERYIEIARRRIHSDAPLFAEAMT